jgi:hypothetical protein
LPPIRADHHRRVTLALCNECITIPVRWDVFFTAPAEEWLLGLDTKA